MATINSLEDFLQALDDNPAWREAVRVRILGEELLQLPARFNAFYERQEAFNERMEASIERLEASNERTEASIERLDRYGRKPPTSAWKRPLSAWKRPSIESINRSIESINGTLEELRRMNANAEARMNRMESDISAVKGGHVRARLKDLSFDLIEGMNLELAHILERSELTLMSRRIPDATPDEIASFRRADMVILAGDRSTNNPVYLAIEASWTGDINDTDRAERNARFLSAATGIAAIPVIASVRNTREVTSLIESGAVRWYWIEERDVQAE
jgi:hypothetical protein